MTKQPEFLPPTLMAVSKRLELPANEYLFRLGSPVEQLYWLIRGELQAIRTAPSGQELVMIQGRAGEFFAEGSLFTPQYTCTALAKKPCVLLAIPMASFRSTLATDVKFADMFLRATVSSLRRQCSRVERLRLRTATERILHFLSCESAADGCCQLTMPLSEWAVDLGLEPETLYRTLRVLEDNGLVQRDKRRMRLCAGCNKVEN
jgi:CRP-like cAMP-binding protein